MSTSTLIETPAAQDEHATLFVGFELGKATWLIGLYAPELGRTVSRYKIDGGDLGKVLAWRTLDPGCSPYVLAEPPGAVTTFRAAGASGISLPPVSAMRQTCNRPD